MAAGIAAALACLCASQVRAQNYIQDDARISGTEVYTFADGAERVTLVLGSFQFSAGGRRIASRDAVLWIRTTSGGRGERHDITIYAEGGAQVAESGGATTSDKLMLVEVHVQGRLLLARPPAEKPLADFPLYGRAKDARTGNQQPLATTQPVAHEAPPLVIAMRPEVTPAAVQGVEKPPAAAPAPPAPKPIVPVFIHADSIVSKKAEKGHVLIVTGNVYLWQGGPTNKATLELRSQAAVVFTEPSEPKEAGEAATPRVASLPSMGGDSNAPGERIAGVYLLDDVVISRGERFMRGPEAYYDFTTDRAIVREPVFRTIQDPRGIPIFVRAQEGRMLSARETWFKNAEISTSDFYTPSYYIHADKGYLMDATHYDQEGTRVGPPALSDKLTGTSLVVQDVPIFYWPYSEGDITEENLAIRRLQVGSDHSFGTGVESEWYLFRLLGLVAPQGFSGTAEIDAYARGEIMGADMKYARQSYSGYSKLYGIQDRNGTESFGDQREHIPAPEWRGWLLERHKQVMDDWEVQLEVSWISDQNFLERFFPSEYYGGKEQETLLYAKKQQDNWAFTALLEQRVNNFLTQTDSYPDLSLYLEGEPVGPLTWYSENHAGVKRYQGADGDANYTSSDVMARGDSRQEVDFPLHLGPVNLTHFAAGRVTGWSDAPPGGDNFRPYGQVGVKVDTSLWKQDQDVESRLWDLHGLRHIVTPEAEAMLSTAGGVDPNDLFPMDPGIEQDLSRMQMWSAGVSQRLQTRRGPPGEERTVDWMRLDVHAGFFYDTVNNGLFPGDGRSFFSRPEDSLPRNHVSGEYQWQISDSTLFLADTNYDVQNQSFDRYDLGVAVQRDPRLEYFFGVRSMQELNSTVGTAGINYQLTDKYRISIFEQYDFQFNNGHNYTSGFTLARKMERWYGALTAVYNQTNNETAIYLTFWPEGVPEMRIGSSRLNFLGASSSN
jgi:hypothetical protein